MQNKKFFKVNYNINCTIQRKYLFKIGNLNLQNNFILVQFFFFYSCTNCCLLNLRISKSGKNTLSEKKGYNIIDEISEKYSHGNI